MGGPDNVGRGFLVYVARRIAKGGRGSYCGRVGVWRAEGKGTGIMRREAGL